jgi:hypothetical protein
MVNEVFKKDLSKFMSESTVSSELPAGETPRRYEPSCGVKAHNSRIHKESNFADKYKNLPFTFSKPSFGEANKRSVIKVCSNCETSVYVHYNAVGIICRNCGKYSSLKEIQSD